MTLTYLFEHNSVICPFSIYHSNVFYKKNNFRIKVQQKIASSDTEKYFMNWNKPKISFFFLQNFRYQGYDCKRLFLMSTLDTEAQLITYNLMTVDGSS